MKITCVISSMGSGGAERVMATLANHWQQQGWSVTLLTLEDQQEPPFYPLNAAIHYQGLNVSGVSTNLLAGLTNNLQRIKTLRNAIRASQPDVVLSFGDKTNIRTLLALTGVTIPLVVAERSDPGAQELGRAWERLRQLAYRMADQIVVQSEGARAYFAAGFQPKITLIPNPVPAPPLRREAPFTNTGDKSCVAMGRLSAEKGFDLLLRAFATSSAHFPNWSLTLIGDGPLRAELEELAKALGIGRRVCFTGRLKNPFAQLVQADLFVMSSRYEGFPNALCEAMACGLPVISFDCPSGPRAIIRHEVDGLLVAPENVDALATAMTRLMGDANLRQQLAAQAPAVLERFSLAKVMGQWEAVVRQAAGRQSRVQKP